MIIFSTMGQSQSELDEEVTLTQIQELYRRFASQCPSGKLHLHEFKKIFGINTGTTEEASAYMENVFRSFDANQDNTIDFMEFVAAVHLVLRGRLDDRLRWSFKVFDRDGNGCLDREEVKHVVKIIYKIKRHGNKSGSEIMTPEKTTERIFELVDKNKDGQISLEEFMEGAQKDPWLLDQLSLDVKPCGWFLEQQRKTKEKELQRKNNK
ncbi:guanylyl cyclase-activating protein 2 [Esox lucius]|uniref:EF-hand domain-containing protein n=1 Tax=Esox lucius TaxID=8010 RepID=A0A3P9ANF4_ESOLU|nr:guanylyl cyclase-activating protein 2 [Esox lucius]